jgi:2-desacetyl-2-hydroxyethyl bacteriochlorophyllide A dehydrogenase
MKAIQLNEYGSEELLKEVEVADPVPGAGHVVVRIHAASYNPIDAKLASGAMRQMMPLTFPWIPGWDFSGVVEALGADVTEFAPGDEVFGIPASSGGYAEKIAVDAKKIARKPDSVGHVDAASLALVAQTATQALEAAALKSGQTVLVLGAGGAVGSIAVQLAHHTGARVIASAASESIDRLRGYGANDVLDYKKTPFETVARDVDVVVDGVGGETLQRAYAVLKQGGSLVTLTQPPSNEETEKRGVKAVMLNTQSSAESLKKLAAQIDAGEIKPLIGRTYPLAKAAQMWSDARTQHVEGKLVLTVAR